MKEYLGSDVSMVWGILFCAVGIYVATVIFTRVAGKRSFSKMSSFDFAMTVALGSVIATTVVSKSVTLVHGIVGLFIIYLLQMIAAHLRRYKWFNSITDNVPLMLMDGETILYENLKKSKVTEADLRSKLREANVLRLSEVKAVIFESTGDISVLHGKEVENVQPFILEGVTR
ncbi:DUF421 domain-containing protein [Flavobacteriaceae bacterium TP-CH-4]|uniref:DUF421 domain-containing protein n=1 Tax=Pelagihabitans pacificus TaxID=2696054 RepID=A0A967AVL4_9FLAO|nr:YetF domain-containing protein [Pelagihabitans pacificus]NHF61028.1 DUF421 domain-containing protein [Pelagihabitans pacificus]